MHHFCILIYSLITSVCSCVWSKHKPIVLQKPFIYNPCKQLFLNMYTPMYATPTFITEALYLAVLMIIANYQTFSSQSKHLSGQIKFGQTNLQYVINENYSNVQYVSICLYLFKIHFCTTERCRQFVYLLYRLHFTNARA